MTDVPDFASHNEQLCKIIKETTKLTRCEKNILNNFFLFYYISIIYESIILAIPALP